MGKEKGRPKVEVMLRLAVLAFRGLRTMVCWRGARGGDVEVPLSETW
jgi:hypothetical protein